MKKTLFALIFLGCNSLALSELGPPPDLTTPPPAQVPAWVDNQIQQPWVANNTGPTPGDIAPFNPEIGMQFPDGGMIAPVPAYIPYHDEL